MHRVRVVLMGNESDVECQPQYGEELPIISFS